MWQAFLSFGAGALLLRSTTGQPVEGHEGHRGHGGHRGYGGQSQPLIDISSTSPFRLSFSNNFVSVDNTAVLVGDTNRSAIQISASRDGAIKGQPGQISYSVINPQVARIEVNTSSDFVGARFAANDHDHFYGVWEYPFLDRQLTNTNVTFEIKGVGDSRGINWSNARAPFFFSSAGYAIYTDSLAMGTYSFTTPGTAEFTFNTSSLVYYIILPQSSPTDYKSLLTAYASLSNTIAMPPDSAYGPIYWSDDWEQDLHGLANAQESYYDVITHLSDYQIHGTAMFADRPYGTGNYSFGNWDFDPKFYPTPRDFIANLTDWGFDFEVWVANRAFWHTQLYNVSAANGWLFPGIDPVFFNGPAVNLSIPEAYAYFKEHLSYYPSVGVKGYKIDRGEEGEMPVYEQNTQIALFEQLCWETMVEQWGEGNFYNFARNIVDRSRSKSAVWNGDAHSNWTGLAYSVTSGIRSGLIGFSQWGSDTGGYIRDADEPHQELWQRWMWFSTFSPMYEIMIGTNHTPWYPTALNPYTPELVEVLKESTDLHFDLLPYVKSYTYQAHKTGVPVMRAAFLEEPLDERASRGELGLEYFFGEHFWVAPIVSPGGEREVYFPGEGKYLEYFNKTAVHSGGSTVEVQVGVHAIPAYVRAGAIVPKGRIFRGNDRWTEAWKPELRIEVFPSREVPCSKFLYYDGEADREVVIEMRMSREGEVVVEFGDLGLGGRVEVFGKRGSAVRKFEKGPGRVVVEGVESLFDE